MKRLFFLALLLPALCAGNTSAQLFRQQSCPNGQCGVPADAVAVQPAAAALHGWYKGEDGKLTLFWEGKRCGSLDPLRAKWQTAGKTHTIDLCETFGIARLGQKVEKQGRDCGPGCDCDGPCRDDCNCQGFVARADEQGVLNHGCDWKSNGGERFTLNGREVAKRQLVDAIAGKSGGAGDIPDDSKLPRLVVLSNDETIRKNILGDFAALHDWQGKVIAQAYPPDDWAVAGLYPMPTDPTLYYCDADGLPRGCSKGYAAGPTGMAMSLAKAEKLRNPTGVDPSKAPDLAKPDSPAGPTSVGMTPNQAGIGGLALLVAGVGLAMYRKK